MATSVAKVPVDDLNEASPNGRPAGQHGTPRGVLVPDTSIEKPIGSWLCTPGSPSFRALIQKCVAERT